MKNMNKIKYLHIFTARRRLLAAGAAMPVLAWTRAVHAQAKPPKVPRIGVLYALSASRATANIEPLRAGLRDFGYVEGKNIAFELRFADGKYERLNELAAELVRLKVDVIVTQGTPGALAAKQATTTIPIVMVSSGDPVASGLVSSLARPGGNVTGFSIFGPEVTAKRLELLKEAVPRIRRVAYLTNPDNPSVTDMKELALAAKSLKLELQQFEVRGPEEFDNAFSEMSKRRIDAVLVDDDGMLIANAKGAADITAKRRLPSAGTTPLAEAGGLIGYGTANILDNWRRAATVVDKILKGAKPADLPIERTTIFDLVINNKTAKALGITIPQTILVRATRVIE